MCKKVVHKTLVHLSASILENKQTRSISNQLVVITFFFLRQRNPKIDANPHLVISQSQQLFCYSNVKEDLLH